MNTDLQEQFALIAELIAACLRLVGFAKRPRIPSEYPGSIYAACGNLAEVISALCFEMCSPSSDCFFDFGPEPMGSESAIELAPGFFQALDELVRASREMSAKFPFAAVGVRS